MKPKPSLITSPSPQAQRSAALPCHLGPCTVSVLTLAFHFHAFIFISRQSFSSSFTIMLPCPVCGVSAALIRLHYFHYPPRFAVFPSHSSHSNAPVAVFLSPPFHSYNLTLLQPTWQDSGSRRQGKECKGQSTSEGTGHMFADQIQVFARWCTKSNHLHAT